MISQPTIKKLTSTTEAVAVFLVIGTWLGYLLVQVPDRSILVPDSESYLNFYPFRTAGYPLFLWITGIEAAKFVLPVVAVVSTLILYIQLRKLFANRAWIPMLVLIGIALNTRFFEYHYTVLTESVYVSLLILVIAAFVRLIREPTSRSSLILLSVLCALCVAVRPGAIFFLPVLIVCLLIISQGTFISRVKLLGIAMLSFVLVVGAERTFSHLWHEGQTSSLLTRHVFAKAALIDLSAASGNSIHDSSLQHAYEPLRKFVRSAPDFYVRYHLIPPYEICVQYACTSGLGLEVDSAEALQAALRRIKANPVGYLVLALNNYRSLWSVYPTAAPSAAERINGYLEKSAPIPFGSEMSWLETAVYPRGPASFAVHLGILALGAAALLVIAVGLNSWIRGRSLSREFQLLLFSALCMHSSQLLTAMTGVSIIRYTIALWPFFVVSACLLLWSLWRLARRRIA